MGILNLFKKIRHDRKAHWEKTYEKNSPNEVSWYQDNPETSLRLINSTNISKDSSIIDIGGGASNLVDFLVDQGYKKLAVLDISGNSIEKAKLRLGAKESNIKWIETDITDCNFKTQYDIWHDRAVFHFLTDKRDRQEYIGRLRKSLKPGGHVIIATFGLNGPSKCNGLKIVKYSPKTLHSELGSDFEIIETHNETHITPTKIKQDFIYCYFKKKM